MWCITQISTQFFEYRGKVAKFISKLERKGHVLSEFSEHAYWTDSSVQTALTEVYGDIFDFCREGLKLFADEKGKERGGLKTIRNSPRQRPESEKLLDRVSHFQILPSASKLWVLVHYTTEHRFFHR